MLLVEGADGWREQAARDFGDDGLGRLAGRVEFANNDDRPIAIFHLAVMRPTPNRGRAERTCPRTLLARHQRATRGSRVSSASCTLS